MRRAITPHERLVTTLRFLATGRTYEDMKFSAMISPQALSYIIPETCEAIYRVLKADYLKFPSTEQEWKNVATDFETRWNFPHCLGALDGKHVRIVPPTGSGSYFFNYKRTHSMILLVIASANYQILLFNFGTNGRVSDGGVLQNTTFFEKLQNKSLHIPEPSQVTNSSRILLYVFVADDAFPLRVDMIKPFRYRNLHSMQRRIYNYRVSRARRIVENVFGILAARFRIFHTSMNLDVGHIESVVKACCALHNFLITSLPNTYAPQNSADIENLEDGTIIAGSTSENSAMSPLQNLTVRNSTEIAKRVRDEFMEYFVNEGEVFWQQTFLDT